METKERGKFGSNFGFLMAAVGSAVGLGNIWGFPYKMGASGGGAFLLVYLLLVIFVGFAVMLGELVIGRRSGLGAVGAYRALSKKFTWLGYIGVFSAFLINCFYCVLGGMVLRYMLGYLVNIFGAAGFDGLIGAEFFGYFTTWSGSVTLFFVIFVALNVLIVRGGIEKGVEKFTKIAMPALAAMILVIIVYVACQPGSKDGYAFMYSFNFDAFSKAAGGVGFFNVLKTAAGQMFFSLSLGMAAIVTYGSYLSKKESLGRNAIIIPIADTVVALMAGMMILPACSAFGVPYGAGPSLLFISMQNVFANMGGFVGNLMGFLFYALVFIAAITSSTSLLEANTTFILDRQVEKGKTYSDRKLYTLLIALVIIVVGLPVALDGLGAGVAGGAGGQTPAEILRITEVSGWNDCWLDFYDLITEGILMPVGAMVMSIVIGWVVGPKVVKEEMEASGHKAKMMGVLNICFKFIVPIVMVVVLYGQLASFFGW